LPPWPPARCWTAPWDATGSALGADGIEAYRRLATDPAHVNAVMTMFANWDVEPLVADYPRLRVPVVLAFGAGDRWIDRAAVERATARIPDARPVEIPGGHLAPRGAPRRGRPAGARPGRETGVLAAA
jgi:pimeloyl-ACP methyl ester carboxylesterase